MSGEDISPQLVKSLVAYDPTTGRFVWEQRPVALFPTAGACRSWNSRYAGRAAFTTLTANGYLVGAIFDRKYRAHRVAWVCAYGAWPDEHIDHINHDRTDNRLANLRAVSQQENNRNVSKGLSNTSGVVGVSLHKASGLWHARIYDSRRCISLGYYSDLSNAAAARAAAEERYGFHKNHGKDRAHV